MSEPITTGATVKAWRKARGLTIDALAAALGLTTGPTKMIEANRRRITADEARAIARICEQDAAPLLALLDAPSVTAATLCGRTFGPVALDLVRRAESNARPRPFSTDDIERSLVVDADGCAQPEEPILVRPIDGDACEIVYGERRAEAARKRGAVAIFAERRDLSDAQAAMLRAVENAAREGLPPLAQAAEMARLRDEHGFTIEQIADAMTGGDVRRVRDRLLLLDAIEPVREALEAGKATIEVVLFFARRPAEAQARAWPRAAEHGDGQGGDVVRLDGWVRRLFASLPLAHAPWPLGMEFLADVGHGFKSTDGAVRACDGCPSNTGRQLALLDGAAEADAECLDAACYGRKAEAWADHLVEQARAAGVPVLEGAAARAAVPLSPSDASGGFVDLDAASPIKGADAKPLTWRLVLGPEVLAKVAPGERAVADLGDGAKELVKIETAVEGAKRRYQDEASSAQIADGVGPVTARENIQALDSFRALAASQRVEVRPAPPAPPEAPKPRAPGTADERKKATKSAAEHIDATLRTLIAGGPLPSRTIDAWALRAVSSDAVCYVTEALGLEYPGAPADALRTAIDDGTPRILTMLLAAELLHRGGETADLVKRAIGAPEKRSAKKTKREEKKRAEEIRDLADEQQIDAEDDGIPFSELPVEHPADVAERAWDSAPAPVVKRVRKGVPPCTCPPGRGRHASGCPTLAPEAAPKGEPTQREPEPGAEAASESAAEDAAAVERTRMDAHVLGVIAGRDGLTSAAMLRVAMRGTSGDERGASIERLIAAGKIRSPRMGHFEAVRP